MPQTGKKKGTPVEQTQQGAGLKMAAHPLLLDHTPTAPQSKKDRYKPMQPKFASIKVCLFILLITANQLSYSQANVRNVPTPTPPPPPIATPSPAANPYSVAGKDGQGATGFDGAPRERSSRSFRFNPKGKYVALANQQRQEAQLEALKQRISESARKAGLDGDMGIEKTIKVCLVALFILHTIIK
jgi:U4/U6 small nuclear ribonucleoprotein PRP3